MDKEGMQELMDPRQSIDGMLYQVVSLARKIVEPLRDLNEEQRFSVAMLGILIQAVTLANRPSSRISADVLDRFKDQLDNICPSLGSAAISGDPCYEASVAYATAKQKCKDDNTPAVECFEAQKYEGILTKCLVNKLECTKREIGVLLARQTPAMTESWVIANHY